MLLPMTTARTRDLNAGHIQGNTIVEFGFCQDRDRLLGCGALPTERDGDRDDEKLGGSMTA